MLVQLDLRRNSDFPYNSPLHKRFPAAAPKSLGRLAQRERGEKGGQDR
jgi:hypothetical protein